jgi:hypothetical protein
MELALTDINKISQLNTPVLFYYNSKTVTLCASPKIGSIMFMHNIRNILPRYNRDFTFILRQSDISTIKSCMLEYLNNFSDTLWSPNKKGFDIWQSIELYVDATPVSFMNKRHKVEIIRNKKLSTIFRYIVPNIKRLYKYLKEVNK